MKRRAALAVGFVCCAGATIAAPRRWIPADPKVACASARDRDLCAELLAMRDRDQLARYDVLEHPGDRAREGKTAEVDRANLARIEAILAARGWPGRSLVGGAAAGSAWTILQHADLAAQKRYAPLMEKAAQSGELDPALWATTVDRIAVREGRPQTYGTQFHEVNGNLVPEPIEDEAHVDERRKKVGLGPLGEYSALLRETYARPVPKK